MRSSIIAWADMLQLLKRRYRPFTRSRKIFPSVTLSSQQILRCLKRLTGQLFSLSHANTDMQNLRWIYIFSEFVASKQLHLAPRGHRFAQLILEHAEQLARSISHPSTVICKGSVTLPVMFWRGLVIFKINHHDHYSTKEGHYSIYICWKYGVWS